MRQLRKAARSDSGSDCVASISGWSRQCDVLLLREVQQEACHFVGECLNVEERTTMSEERTCTKCGETKPIEEFARRSGGCRRWKCGTCQSEYLREYRIANADSLLEKKQIYNEANREKIRDRHEAWCKKNPERRASYQRITIANSKTHRFRTAIRDSATNARRYGHAPCSSTFSEVMEAFSGVCHACGMTEEDQITKTGRRLNMDHCHATGEFRGWVCCTCNTNNALATA